VTLQALPLIALYRASKAAVNAFPDSMALELEPFGVRARLVLPARSTETRFGDNAAASTTSPVQTLVKKVFAELPDTSTPTTGRWTSPKPCSARRPTRCPQRACRYRRRSTGGRGSLNALAPPSKLSRIWVDCRFGGQPESGRSRVRAGGRSAPTEPQGPTSEKDCLLSFEFGCRMTAVAETRLGAFFDERPVYFGT
jgi:hypothetical protein